MSKSYDNAIYIFDEEKTLKKKVMKIVTDSTPVEDPKDPDKCNVFALYKLFADKNQLEEMRLKYVNGGTGYGEAKKELFGLIWEYFAEARKKREMLGKNPDEIRNILKKGALKTRKLAVKTLDDVKKKIGLVY